MSEQMRDDLKIDNPTREQRIIALKDAVSGVQAMHYSYDGCWCVGDKGTCLESLAVLRAMLEELGDAESV